MPGHDARACRAARDARAPSARACVGAGARPRAASTVGRPDVGVAARRRRARDVDARARPRATAADAPRVRGRRSTTRSTRSRDRDFVQEFLRCAAICATHLSRLAADLARWTDPALGWARARRGLHDGLEHDAAEAEPRRRPSSRARRPHASPAGSSRCRRRPARPPARVPPRPPGGQGAGVRRGRHARAGPAGVGRGGRDRPVRPRGDARGRVRRRAASPPTSPRRSSTEGCPSERRIAARVSCCRSSPTGPRSMRDLTADEWSSFGVLDGAALLDPEASVRARGGAGGPSPASVVDQADAIEVWLAAR